MSDPLELQSLKDRLEYKRERLDSFQNNPQTEINDRLDELSQYIDKLDDRQTKNEDAMSMLSYHKKLKRGLEQDPKSWVSWRINKLKDEINQLETEVSEY